MAATWVFLRHFEKEAHPFTFTEAEITEAAAHPTLAEMLVDKWDIMDQEDVPLSKEGRRQAFSMSVQLPEYLRARDVTIDRIIASPYLRTHESAELIRTCCFTHLKVAHDERLVELKNGVRNFCLDDFDRTCALWPEYGEAAHNAFLEAAPPYGESHASARDGRIRSFLKSLKKLEGGTLIVTHAGVIECVHQIVYGTSDDDVVRKFSERRSARYGSLLVCEYERSTDCITPVIDEHCLYELS